MKKRLQLALMALGITTLLTLSACNTMDGVGEDMEEAGEEIQEATY